MKCPNCERPMKVAGASYDYRDRNKQVDVVKVYECRCGYTETRTFGIELPTIKEEE